MVVITTVSFPKNYRVNRDARAQLFSRGGLISEARGLQASLHMCVLTGNRGWGRIAGYHKTPGGGGRTETTSFGRNT